MKIAFIGGVKMGRDCLEEILSRGIRVEAIFCLPESESGRSGYANFDGLGKKYGIPLHKLADINSSEAVGLLRGISPDLIAVIGWSGIIGKEVLAIPKRGVLGHHPTLLPKHRGNAPIPWTLINGLARSGVTFFFMTEAIDAGDIAGQAEFEVTLEDDAASVYEKATRASARLLAEILPKIGSGKLVAKKQDAGRISRWGKRRPEDGIIDWNCMTIYLYNWVRGLSRPYPGAFTFLSGRKVLVWKARMAEKPQEKGTPGEVLLAGGGLAVKTGDGALELLRVQLEGEGETDGAEFAKRHKLKPGTVLGE